MGRVTPRIHLALPSRTSSDAPSCQCEEFPSHPATQPSPSPTTLDDARGFCRHLAAQSSPTTMDVSQTRCDSSMSCPPRPSSPLPSSSDSADSKRRDVVVVLVVQKGLGHGSLAWRVVLHVVGRPVVDENQILPRTRGSAMQANLDWRRRTFGLEGGSTTIAAHPVTPRLRSGMWSRCRCRYRLLVDDVTRC